MIDPRNILSAAASFLHSALFNVVSGQHDESRVRVSLTAKPGEELPKELFDPDEQLANKLRDTAVKTLLNLIVNDYGEIDSEVIERSGRIMDAEMVLGTMSNAAQLLFVSGVKTSMVISTPSADPADWRSLAYPEDKYVQAGACTWMTGLMIGAAIDVLYYRMHPDVQPSGIAIPNGIIREKASKLSAEKHWATVPVYLNESTNIQNAGVPAFRTDFFPEWGIDIHIEVSKGKEYKLKVNIELTLGDESSWNYPKITNQDITTIVSRRILDKYLQSGELIGRGPLFSLSREVCKGAVGEVIANSPELVPAAVSPGTVTSITVQSTADNYSLYTPSQREIFGRRYAGASFYLERRFTGKNFEDGVGLPLLSIPCRIGPEALYLYYLYKDDEMKVDHIFRCSALELKDWFIREVNERILHPGADAAPQAEETTVDENEDDDEFLGDAEDDDEFLEDEEGGTRYIRGEDGDAPTFIEARILV